MKLVIKKDRSVDISNPFIGYEGEKNIDKVKLITDNINLAVSWYLLFEERMLPFTDMEIDIDERMTSKEGFYSCRIIGTDAKAGQPVTAGERVFISDIFELEVR